MPCDALYVGWLIAFGVVAVFAVMEHREAVYHRLESDLYQKLWLVYREHLELMSRSADEARKHLGLANVEDVMEHAEREADEVEKHHPFTRKYQRA